jgi:nucleotide-binding universal stress UspA family protein
MEAKGFIKRILVPTDGSASSIMAEETAAQIAKKTQATVTILQVMQELKLSSPLPPNVEEELSSRVEQEAEKIISEARALFAEEGITVDTKIIRRDNPADIVLELSSNHDLVVMGTRGESEKDPFALGSVAKNVVRHTMCPTIIVKEVSGLSNMLVGIDGSEHSMKTFEYAIRLAENMGSKITLVYVLERRIHTVSSEAANEVGHQTLAKALNSVKKGELEVEKKLEFGVPSDVIVELAETGKHDLIVLGSRGFGAVRRFLLGSVSDDVCMKARCSVLIVPMKG